MLKPLHFVAAETKVHIYTLILMSLLLFGCDVSEKIRKQERTSIVDDVEYIISTSSNITYDRGRIFSFTSYINTDVTTENIKLTERKFILTQDGDYRIETLNVTIPYQDVSSRVTESASEQSRTSGVMVTFTCEVAPCIKLASNNSSIYTNYRSFYVVINDGQAADRLVDIFGVLTIPEAVGPR